MCVTHGQTINPWPITGYRLPASDHRASCDRRAFLSAITIVQWIGRYCTYPLVASLIRNPFRFCPFPTKLDWKKARWKRSSRCRVEWKRTRSVKQSGERTEKIVACRSEWITGNNDERRVRVSFLFIDYTTRDFQVSNFEESSRYNR